jgi:DinB superfamily
MTGVTLDEAPWPVKHTALRCAESYGKDGVMRYVMLNTMEQDRLFSELEAMPGFLAASFATASASDAVVSGPNDTFSPVEHCWHLADLEREGYAVRIRRLREEMDPLLPDFDGARIARERDYASRSLAAGIAAFRAARLENLSFLRAVTPEDWLRRGTQEGVGAISLCDVPAMMAEHDAAHRQEIAAWTRARLEP